MTKHLPFASSALRHLSLALRLADLFAARHNRPRLTAYWVALRGLRRAVQAQRAHPDLPLLSLFVYGYLLSELNAWRRGRH